MLNGSGQHIGYKPKDFLFYVLSLGITGAACDFVFRRAMPLRIAVWASLAYLLVVFVHRRGAALDRDFLPELARGLLGYPKYLATMNWHARPKLLRFGGLLLASCALEWLAFRYGGERLSGSVLARPFPWIYFVAVHFLIIDGFRTAVLVAHLRKQEIIAEVLGDSRWAKHSLKNMGVVSLCIHGYVTGTLAHLCLCVPYIAFWQLTQPTVLRELLMFVISMVIASVRKDSQAKDVAEGDHDFMVAHEIQHRSRFGFTVFHGQHHDAIPCALIGASGGAAFVENLDRGLYRGDVFDSIVMLLVRETAVAIWDMTTHQYIPGIFPYCTTIRESRLHHVVHHYGSLLPLGEGFAYPTDVDYRPKNAIARWFLDKVEKHEGLEPAQREEFLAVARPLEPKRGPKMPVQFDTLYPRPK